MEFNLYLLGLVAAALIISINSKSLVPTTENGKLNVISLSHERLEMAYYKSTEEAIHVISEVQNDGETVHLSITTMTGGVIFSVDRPFYSTALWSFAGNEFLLVNETQSNNDFKFTTYYVPSENSETLKNEMNHKGQLRSGLLNQLDHDNVNETGRTKIEEFLMNPEVSLLVEAAETLGKRGIRGIDSQPAMIFYTAALRFSRMMQEVNEDGSAEITDEITDEKPARRQKRWWSSTCSNNGYSCTVCPIGNECLGMCGPGCHTCWSFVCGHCCFSPGCYAHDLICSIRDQQFSPECIITSPLGLACRLY